MLKMKLITLSSALVLSLAITPTIQADVAGIKG